MAGSPTTKAEIHQPACTECESDPLFHAETHSELVAPDVAVLDEHANGLRVIVRRSKTDQEEHRYEKAIPHGWFIQPVALVREWLDAAGITDEPVFRPVS